MGQVSYTKDGDSGCGAPGDPQWHLCCIAQLEDADIAQYIFDSLAVKISGDNIRKKAEDVINGNSKGDS